MSAERLREAARLLRSRAEAATGPGNHSWYDDVDSFGQMLAAEFPADDLTAEAAAFIATMSPPVALSLADWIDSVADMARKRGVKKFARGYKSALDAADAILGGRA